ncbi:MAG: hypothetical protein HWQ35_00640 [Nostoc sp. NMS1]|uniref:hypothetical protein n=1 Tax=unclassified Nostoc TaxID=2593658 RepID=UPI0025E2A67A|nr:MULTISPECIES: hypothetical protein [unclassified Nostoc]MBN3905132.1 hypothetical protein [Nostoc sp. NMS1]MBN3989236.1 hypothetical protein [Nostoc sp. NMS2]
MNNQILEDIPQPDPAWDYYLTYHTLLKAKSRLDKLINEISEFEEASVTQDEYFEEQLLKILKTLSSTLPKIETE